MTLSDEARELMYLINQNLEAITKGIERFQMNVSLQKYMSLLWLSKYRVREENDGVVLCIALKTLIRVIEPMVPHLAEECWALTI